MTTKQHLRIWTRHVWTFVLLATFWLTITTRGQTADSFIANVPNHLRTIAVQPDGKVLIGGDFSSIDGQTRYRFARLHSTGTLDTVFNPPPLLGRVNTITVLKNGKILLGGLPWMNLTNSLVRLNPDGTLDSSFNPYRPTVSALGVQKDGKLIVLAGQVRRLNVDGTLDESFSVTLQFFPEATNFRLDQIAVQADNKILIAGQFSTDQKQTNIVRLNPDGSRDTSFNGSVNGMGVASLAVQPDGKVLIGGSFSKLSGQTRVMIGRLHSDGTADPTFNPGANSWVECLAVQADGKILVGGPFSTLAGQPRTGIGRLNPDGTIDDTFNPESNGYPWCFASQTDGKLLLAGTFNSLSGQPRTNIARLDNTTSITNELSANESSVTWLRGGSSPEVIQTSFDISLDGQSWTHLGSGTRTTNGWELTGVSIPETASIRASGLVEGSGISTWYAKEILIRGTPRIDLVTTNNTFGVYSNLFRFQISGLADLPVILEASTNLTDWQSVSTNRLPIQSLTVEDALTNDLMKVYRARLQ